MDEIAYTTLRYKVMKKYMAILAIEDQELNLYISGDWDDEKILKLKEETHYEQLKKDCWEMVADWEKLLENTAITSENLEFIKFSKSFLSQFKDTQQDMHDLKMERLHQLIKLKRQAALTQRYETAAACKKKIMELAATF